MTSIILNQLNSQQNYSTEKTKFSMLSQLKIEFEQKYNSIIARHRSKSEAAYDRRNVSYYLDKSIQLSPEEKNAVKQKWGGIINCISRGFEYYRGIKALKSFDPNYLPSSYFFPYIEGILNPISWKQQLGHKSMIELAYGLGIKHPRTLLRTYGGVFLNEFYKPLTNDDAISVINKFDAPLLYKPATESEQGDGIKLIDQNMLHQLCQDIKTGQIFENKTDFVLQVPVEQSADTARFNPSSLNCMRITTINVNNRISVGSRAIKCGPKGSIVDNIGSGKRGVIVGVNPNGTLCENGLYGNGEIAEGHNGVTFKNSRIRHFQRVVDAAINLHQYAPLCKIIGWDIALDSDNDAVLIEGNVVYPGISMEQMCSGPIFGERTEEVIAYIEDYQKRHKL